MSNLEPFNLDELVPRNSRLLSPKTKLSSPELNNFHELHPLSRNQKSTTSHTDQIALYAKSLLPQGKDNFILSWIPVSPYPGKEERMEFQNIKTIHS